jgi:hypothetical protein
MRNRATPCDCGITNSRHQKALINQRARQIQRACSSPTIHGKIALEELGARRCPGRAEVDRAAFRLTAEELLALPLPGVDEVHGGQGGPASTGGCAVEKKDRARLISQSIKLREPDM